MLDVQIPLASPGLFNMYGSAQLIRHITPTFTIKGSQGIFFHSEQKCELLLMYVHSHKASQDLTLPRSSVHEWPSKEVE